jgi:allantoin racemase
VETVRILWINPVGTDQYDPAIGALLKREARKDTRVDVVSLPDDRPKHLEYHAYEAVVTPDIVGLVHAFRKRYDAFVIGCFYDVALREAREVSGDAVVLAPCQSSLVYAAHLGTSFSVLVGRRKWIPKMEENIRAYGHGDRLASMRPLELGVLEFQRDPEETARRMLAEGKRAVEEDGAELLILGCTIEYGFYRKMQEGLGVPVIDAVLSPFKLAESLGESALRFGWTPSRRGGCESPPEEEAGRWGLGGEPPVGKLLEFADIPAEG